MIPITKKYFLLFLFAALPGCSDIIVTEPDKPNNVADFDAAWQTVKLVYPYLEFKKINWDSIRIVFRPRAEAARGDEIEGVLFDLLKELKDGHVRLQTKGGASVATYVPPRVYKDRYSYNPLVIRKYFNNELKLSGDQRVEYEILDNSIGYIYIATLVNEEPILNGFDEALTYVKDTKGLIIDVRHNGGGSDYNSVGIVSRLITIPTDDLPYHIPGGGLHQGSSILPRGPFQYTKPVVLLINGVCFSACEDFAETMKHIPTVTAIGDTTAGASGAPQLYALPSGREIRISTKYIPRYDGLPIEWNGILPDIRVPQTEEDLKQGRDKQLEYAINFLQQLLSRNLQK